MRLHYLKIDHFKNLNGRIAGPKRLWKEQSFRSTDHYFPGSHQWKNNR
jgi:hypothetical protein